MLFNFLEAMGVAGLLDAETIARAKWVYHYVLLFSGTVAVATGVAYVIWGVVSRELRELGTNRRLVRTGLVALAAGVALLAGGYFLGQS